MGHDERSRIPYVRTGPGAGPALEWENAAVLMTLEASQGLIGPDVAGMSVQITDDEITIHVCLRAYTEAVVEDMDDLVFELEALMAGVVIPMPQVTVVAYVGPLDASWPGHGHRRIFTAHDGDS